MMMAKRNKRSLGLPRYHLNQGRVIVRLFLVSSLLLICLGFAGALQSGLATIGAGQTELAYSVANLRNNASLEPIQKTPRFSFETTADTDLQNYFVLDTDTGTLTLRDGLRSLANLSNPLKSFPYQIIEAVPGQPKKNVISLYIQLLDCKQFLAMQANSGHGASTASPRPADGDAVLRCIDIEPVLAQASTLSKVKDWIKQNSVYLLDTQKDEYLNAANEILSLPTKQVGSSTTSQFAWGPGSPPLPKGSAKEIPVWRLLILQDKAMPGLQIFAVSDSPTPILDAKTPAPASEIVAPESMGASLLRALDQLFLVILQLRYPALIILGVLAPLLAWIIRQRDKVVRRCLEPYLLLLLAQILSLILADALMGEGLAIWVGFMYTLIRLLQLSELFWMGRSADRRIQRLFNLRSRPWLRDLLRLQLLLWSINALGLAWHILGVFRSFPLISPA
jgi:hypothetical protein